MREQIKPAGRPAGRQCDARIDDEQPLVTAARVANYICPVNRRLARPGVLPGFRKKGRTTRPRRRIEISFINQVLSAHSLGSELACPNPAADSFGVAINPARGFRHGQHVVVYDNTSRRCCNSEPTVHA